LGWLPIHCASPWLVRGLPPFLVLPGEYPAAITIIAIVIGNAILGVVQVRCALARPRSNPSDVATFC
jgi:hypothetical protein